MNTLQNTIDMVLYMMKDDSIEAKAKVLANAIYCYKISVVYDKTVKIYDRVSNIMDKSKPIHRTYWSDRTMAI